MCHEPHHRYQQARTPLPGKRTTATNSGYLPDAAGRTDQFVLKVGDRVSGELQNPTIEMTLTTGATIALEKGNIASITFAREE